jgi:hypothetical protein
MRRKIPGYEPLKVKRLERKEKRELEISTKNDRTYRYSINISALGVIQICLSSVSIFSVVNGWPTVQRPSIVQASLFPAQENSHRSRANIIPITFPFVKEF